MVTFLSFIFAMQYFSQCIKDILLETGKLENTKSELINLISFLFLLRRKKLFNT